MKNQKFLYFLIAGLVAVLLFSFKQEETRIKTTTVRSYFNGLAGHSINVYLPETTVEYKVRGMADRDARIAQILKELSQYGWRIVGTNTYSADQAIGETIYLQKED